jgi:hypothetical protein
MLAVIVVQKLVAHIVQDNSFLVTYIPELQKRVTRRREAVSSGSILMNSERGRCVLAPLTFL